MILGQNFELNTGYSHLPPFSSLQPMRIHSRYRTRTEPLIRLVDRYGQPNPGHDFDPIIWSCTQPTRRVSIIMPRSCVTPISSTVERTDRDRWLAWFTKNSSTYDPPVPLRGEQSGRSSGILSEGRATRISRDLGDARAVDRSRLPQPEKLASYTSDQIGWRPRRPRRKAGVHAIRVANVHQRAATGTDRQQLAATVTVSK